jgi:FeS assembly SUF system protein
MENNILHIETEIVSQLKQIYDPEIPVNIYDLGLIYDIEIDEEDRVMITMTLTAPNCPVADSLLLEVRQKVETVEGVRGAEVNLVFDPPWDPSMLSDEAKLELGML